MSLTRSPSIWTVGHSNHDWIKFDQLLSAADINAVADVRSAPSSRLPHFSRAGIKARLNASGTAYVYLGLELGGRPGAAADYEVMAKQQLFLEGLARVEEIASRTRLALMCSEHEPLACHRCLLVGRRLADRGVGVAHILRDGQIEPHAQTEERLLRLTRQTEGDLFAAREDCLARAYRMQNHRLVAQSR
jgi:uncharacterized protein (DUF488 family)